MTITLPKITLPTVHWSVNVVGFLTTIASAVVGFATSNPQLVAGLFPAHDAAAVTLVLGAVATLWPDTRAGGESTGPITPSENTAISDILPEEVSMALNPTVIETTISDLFTAAQKVEQFNAGTAITLPIPAESYELTLGTTVGNVKVAESGTTITIQKG
jgi:hypothetical protein